jgi:hypothetical protein
MKSCTTILHAKGTKWHLFGELEESHGKLHSEQLQHDEDLTGYIPNRSVEGYSYTNVFNKHKQR